MKKEEIIVPIVGIAIGFALVFGVGLLLDYLNPPRKLTEVINPPPNNAIRYKGHWYYPKVDPPKIKEPDISSKVDDVLVSGSELKIYIKGEGLPYWHNGDSITIDDKTATPSQVVEWFNSDPNAFKFVELWLSESKYRTAYSVRFSKWSWFQILRMR